MTSVHLEQTINKRIHLRKTGKGGKKVPRAPLVVSDLRYSERSFYHYTSTLNFNPLSHVIYMQVHDVFRNYLARIRASENNFLFYVRHIQLFGERLSERVHSTIPKGIVGGFEFTVLQRNLKKWHERPWTYV